MPFFDQFRPKRPVMNMCMMGPKAVGKTTVMTAVFNETQTSIYGTSLNLTAKGDTGAELMDRLHMLYAVFAKKKDITDNSNQVANAGISASATVTRFDFGFGHLGKEPVIDITAKDFPGEMVLDRPDEVKTFILQSHCVMVAIDTPHLMERGGEFNNVKNKPQQVMSLFADALADINTEKLVLLVPLKCEKYFHEQRMGEVLAKVEATYADLIKLLSATGKVCCAVAPILTLGGVEFDDFSYNADGSVQLAPDGCPAGVKYKYASDCKYAPLFCSQPLYSLLLFVAAQYKRESGRLSIMDMLRNLIWRAFRNDDQLFDEILKMNRNRIADDQKLGYKVMCGGNLFNI